MTIVANNTKKVKIGTAVTETFRHHPAQLAHMIITLDHFSKSRIILGIGAGERENIVPYGIEWEKPVSRLAEAIEIIRILWKEEKKVDFDGKFWKLEDAVLSLKPYRKKKPPPIWIGAFGPRMLELTGKVGDGWFPFNLNLEDYKDGLKKIQDSAKIHQRDHDEITPAVELLVIIDENQDECDRMVTQPLIKNQMLTMKDEAFREYGISHPLGDNFYGALDYIPTRYDRKTLLDAYEKISLQMCKDYAISGTPDEVIGKIEEYAKIGAKHIVIFNFTPVADINKLLKSTESVKKVLDYFKEDKSKVLEAVPS
jgi:phthiodiolone/phenolphthiodiolone dimycocerosates ketoreductase